ncbi:MAG: diacylglycerol kinase family protein, partial [Prosthecobacter sp.]|uniref:diacylglycerol kinase family protein n=1 Tax=Prosthecobacter sp. TaxID=1965333 RepID=UPI003BB0F6F7
MTRWLASVLRSFGPALAGLAWALKTQRNLQVHGLATVLVAGLGLWLNLAAWEWCVVLLAVGLVLAAELLNTAIEVLAD